MTPSPLPGQRHRVKRTKNRAHYDRATVHAILDAGLIGHVAGYERLALDAAIHGGRDRVVRAMLAHPLVGQYDRAEKLTELLIARNQEHLAWAR